jgi:hypothetical protein
MTEPLKNVTCPVCDGEGELSPSALLERFATPELRKRLDGRIAEIAEMTTPDAGVRGKVLNFEKEVHVWNPALPIWRRSPKE